MERFGMTTCRLKPGANGVRMEATGMFDGDDGATPSDQGDDECDGLLRSTTTMKGCAVSSGEGVATERAAVAAFLSTVDRDVAFAALSSCRTGGVDAPLVMRIHG
jgi:hypothetical protein